MANEHTLYSVRLPYAETVDLSAARRWLAAIWQALPRSMWRRLLGDQHHVSLELVGTGDGVRYLIGLPSRLLFDSVADQLAAHFPGATLEPVEDDYMQPGQITATIELGSARAYDQSLLVPKTSEADPLAGVLASLRGIEAGLSLIHI